MTYRVNGQVTVSCYAIVEAKSPEEAIRKARKFAGRVTTDPAGNFDEGDEFFFIEDADGSAVELNAEPEDS